MILENYYRFKFAFMNCKSYADLIERGSEVIQEIETFRELGVAYMDSEDDYHRFVIDTNDKRKIKRLKRMGFIKVDEDGLFS